MTHGPAHSDQFAGGMTHLFHIYPDDLETLERIVPKMADMLMPQMDNALRTQLRQVQHVLSQVRWNYGPPTDIETIPADDAEATP